MPWTYRFPIAFREILRRAAVRLEVTVPRASLHGFVNALRGLRDGSVACIIIIHTVGKTCTIELRHDPGLQFKPPQPMASRQGITWSRAAGR